MAEQLLTASIQAPGFSGLNIQDDSVQLTSGHALEANNCVKGGLSLTQQPLEQVKFVQSLNLSKLTVI